MWRVVNPVRQTELHARPLWAPPVVAPGGTSVFIVDGESSSATNRIIALEPGTWREQWQFHFDTTQQGIYGWAIRAISTDGQRVYLQPRFTAVTATSEEKEYRVLTAADGQLVASSVPKILDHLHGCETQQVIVGPNEQVVYAICQEPNNEHGFGSLHVVHADTQQSARLPLPGLIDRVVVGADGRTLYTITTTSHIVAIDVLQGQIVQDIAVPLSPLSSQPLSPYLLALAADGLTLVVGRNIRDPDVPMGTPPHQEELLAYAAARMTGAELYVFDTRTWQELSRFTHDQPIGPCEMPRLVAVSADGRRLYAATFTTSPDGYCPQTTNMIVGFDTATGNVQAQYHLENPHAQYDGENIGIMMSAP